MRLNLSIVLKNLKVTSQLYFLELSLFYISIGLIEYSNSLILNNSIKISTLEQKSSVKFSYLKIKSFVEIELVYSKVIFCFGITSQPF